MNRRHVLQALAAVTVAGPLSNSFARVASANPTRVRSLMRESLILDMLGGNAPVSPVTRQPSLTFGTWIEKYKKAGVTWVSMTAGSDFCKSTGELFHILGTCRRYFLERPDEYLFVETTDDVMRAKREGKLAVNFNLQGSTALEGDLNLVEPLRKLGVGHMLLTYNEKNLAGGGSHDHDNPGLSFFGRQLVKEMNRVGMVVDGSHMSIRSTMEMFALSKTPIVLSHSVARKLRDHERNVTDEQIKGCAQTGGVIGINTVSIFLSKELYDTSAAQMFRHVDYIAELVGPQHVGIGTDHIPDMDEPVGENVMAILTDRYGVDQYPPMNRFATAGPSVIEPLTDEMVRHGYTDEQIKGILGENFMRVFKQVWGRVQ